MLKNKHDMPTINHCDRTSCELLQNLLTYQDLARITGESVMTHRRRKLSGTGPQWIRIGRHVRFDPKDVANWLQQCKEIQGQNA